MANIDKVTLTPEGVEALRAQANAVPAAIEAFREASKKVYSTIESVDGDGGPHHDEILEIVSHIMNELTHVEEAVEAIPVMLNKKANRIEELINKKI